MTCSTSEGANTKRQCAERAVRSGMAVAADHDHAGMHETVFRNDHMDYAIVGVFQVVQIQAIFLTIVCHDIDLFPRNRVGNWQVAVFGRDAMVHCRQDAVGITDFAMRQAQPFKGLRASHFVHQVAVNINQGRLAFGLNNQMAVPDFFIHGKVHGFFLTNGCSQIKITS